MLATLFIITLFITLVSRIVTRVRKAFAEIEGLPMVQPDNVYHQEQPEPEEVSYFTYENEMSDVAFQPTEKPQHETVVEPSFAAIPVSAYSETEGFDLRKAVIYEAILCNPYKG